MTVAIAFRLQGAIEWATISTGFTGFFSSSGEKCRRINRRIGNSAQLPIAAVHAIVTSVMKQTWHLGRHQYRIAGVVI